MDKQLVDGEFTQDELRFAFERVQNPENWKLPIDKTLEIKDHRDLRMIQNAVIHFAGCTANAKRLHRRSGKVYRITAVGYYAAVGA